MLTSLRVRLRLALSVAVALVITVFVPEAPQARQATVSGLLSLVSDQPIALRDAARQLDVLERSGTLRVTSSADDWFAPGFRHDRLQQVHLGLPVIGGDVVRQYSGGINTAVFGSVFQIERNDISAKLSAEHVSQQLLSVPGAQLLRSPALKWLGQPDGDAILVYEAFVTTSDNARVVYVDADTGEERASISLVHRQAAVGEGLGVLGDRKKVSASGSGSGFRLDDRQRPPVLQTIDLKGSSARYAQLRLQASVGQSDLAVDADNVWTDAPAVDAHVYMGWTYDFLAKRLGFRGLNNGNAPMFGAINLLSPQDCVLQPEAIGGFCANAFWVSPPFGPDGRGMMFFGNGLPSAFTLGGQTVRPLAGALDIVAHELTHGVTSYTSALVYRNESGALNEAFSDMMGTAAEAFYQPRGPQYQGADYTMGEDVFRGATAGTSDGNRSMASPTLYGDPDHYGLRQYIGSLSTDAGGVHINSGIANHAYYLAIEGGTNRVSGRSVTGVGFANREQIERTFFRAFTSLLTSGATFYQARLATIQSARDLYGVNGNVERAVTQAWDAVGVTSAGAALTTRSNPNPVPASATACGSSRPGFFLTLSVSEFQNVAFNVQGFDVAFYDSSDRLLGVDTQPASTFAQIFNNCGSGSTQIRAGATACSNICVSLGGRSSGAMLWRFRGTDSNGNVGTFISDPIGLGRSLSGVPDDPNAAYGPAFMQKAQ